MVLSVSVESESEYYTSKSPFFWNHALKNDTQKRNLSEKDCLRLYSLQIDCHTTFCYQNYSLIELCLQGARNHNILLYPDRLKIAQTAW